MRAWDHAPVAHAARDRGHGRDETRTLQVLPAPGGMFPHAARAFLIERTVRDQLRSSVAVLRLAEFTSTAPGRRWAARNATRPVAALDLAL